jgi:hypothetical protein
MTSLLAGLALLGALASAPTATGPAPEELIANGSFELPVIPPIDRVFTAPSTAISGWVVTDQSVDINRTSDIFGIAHSGDQMVDINGSGPGTLTQTFPTSSGRTYLLTLLYSNNPNPSQASPEYYADVTLTGAGPLYAEFLTHAGATPSDMKWTPLAQTFVANSPSTTLRLRSRIQGYNGVVFDTVSVVTIAEPSTFATAAIGAAAILWLAGARRRGRVHLAAPSERSSAA